MEERTCDWRGCDDPVAVTFAIGQYDYSLCSRHECEAQIWLDSNLKSADDDPAAAGEG